MTRNVHNSNGEDYGQFSGKIGEKREKTEAFGYIFIAGTVGIASVSYSWFQKLPLWLK